MKPITPVLLMALLAPLAAQTSTARADDSNAVIVRAVASRGYVRPAAAPKPAKAETYLFFQGPFHEGSTGDPSLHAVKFLDIAKALAPGLAREGYFPTRDTQRAGLLIVIEWGATIGQYNPNRLQEEDLLNRSIADYHLAADNNPAQNVFLTANENDIISNDQVSRLEEVSADWSMMGTAKLLGLKGQFEHAQKLRFASSGKSDAEVALDAELKEDRYFIILKAYDYQTVRKGGNPRMVWSVRINTSATGTPFSTALASMSTAAAGSFGTGSFAFHKKDHKEKS